MRYLNVDSRKGQDTRYSVIRNHKRHSQGFTLIELLVVIAIIAILSVVVILTLNPAELLRQSRDSNRISDLATIKSAISLFLADGQATSTTSLGTARTCYMYGSPAPSSSCLTWFATQTATSGIASRAVSGAGWIPVNFSAISSGAPLGQEPIDPTNNANLFYSYISTSTNYGFKLAAKLESTKYSASGTSDVVSTDGGTDNTTYEQGTNLTL